MKKTVLLLILAVLMPLAVVAQQKIATVNTQEIIAAMPEVKTAEARIKELDQKYSAELQAMNDEYRKKADAFLKEQSTLSEAISQSRQQELIGLQTRIEQSAQAMQQDMEKQQQTLMMPIQQKVLEAIKKVGDAQGIAYVMEQGMMLYSGATAIDLTAKVKAQLGIK